MAILHFVPDQQAYPAVAELVAALPSGSYLAVTHGVATPFGPEQAHAVSDVYQRSTTPDALGRVPAEVERFFAGLEFVEPGLVPVSEWTGGAPAAEVTGPEQVGLIGGVARKP